jgi:hypothetical protein
MREVPARLGGADQKCAAVSCYDNQNLAATRTRAFSTRTSAAVLCTGSRRDHDISADGRVQQTATIVSLALLDPYWPYKKRTRKPTSMCHSAHSGIRMPCNGLVSWRSRTFGRFFFLLFTSSIFFVFVFLEKPHFSSAHFWFKFWY